MEVDWIELETSRFEMKVWEATGDALIEVAHTRPLHVMQWSRGACSTMWGASQWLQYAIPASFGDSTTEASIPGVPMKMSGP